MTVEQAPCGADGSRASVPARGGEYDWPSSPLLELWAMRVRLDAACRKGEAREGWVSCRVLRKLVF